jgi:hypothetical protein
VEVGAATVRAPLETSLTTVTGGVEAASGSQLPIFKTIPKVDEYKVARLVAIDVLTVECAKKGKEHEEKAKALQHASLGGSG